MGLCNYKPFIHWVSFTMLTCGKKSFWPQWMHVSDAIFAVPAFGQHVFLLQTRVRVLYPVLLIDPCIIHTLQFTSLSERSLARYHRSGLLVSHEKYRESTSQLKQEAWRQVWSEGRGGGGGAKPVTVCLCARVWHASVGTLYGLNSDLVQISTAWSQMSLCNLVRFRLMVQIETVFGFWVRLG